MIQESEALTLFSQGLNRHEIADEMAISDDHLAVVLRRAAAKGYAVPPLMPKRPPTGVSTAALLKTREDLRRRGVTGRSVNAMIAARFNLETPCVRMRLIRHDRLQGVS